MKLDGKISEAVEVGIAMEAEERLRFPDLWRRGLEIAQARRAGRTIDEQAYVPPDIRKRVCAAIGMKPYSFYRASRVVVAAKENPEKFGDLLERMDRTGNINGSFEELTCRLSGKPYRPQIFRKMHLRKYDREMQRGIDALGGIAIVLKEIPLEQLDRSKLEAWGVALKSAIGSLHNVVREMKRYGQGNGSEQG